MASGQGDGWDDRGGTEQFSGVMTARHDRRELLGAAAGGLALVTSGLLLPHWLVDETDAADNPAGNIQRRASKRRQRRHRRIDSQRRGKRNDENHAPSGRRTKEIMFIAHNDRARDVEIQVFVDEASVGTKWVSRPPFRLSSGTEKELAYHSNQVGFGVTWDSGRGTFISAIDPLVGSPSVTIRHRGENGPRLMEEDFPVVNGIRTFQHWANRGPETWTIWRINDTANYIVFDVRFKILDSTP